VVEALILGDQMFIHKQWPGTFLIVSAMFVSGCAQVAPSVIHTQRFEKPSTVAIVEAPMMRNVAVIESFLGGVEHFGQQADQFFIPDPGKAGLNRPVTLHDFTAAAVQNQMIQQLAIPGAGGDIPRGLVGGVAVGTLIQASANATARKAVTYHADVMRQVPDLNLHGDVYAALRAALAANGVRTFTVPGGQAALPRLRWPARDIDGRVYPSSSDANAPAVDADLLVQVSPLAFWFAPGPLNNFRRHVSLGVAVYDGRTRQFMGKQTFEYSTSAWQGEYATYGSLLNDTPVATALLRDALLSLVPQVAAVVSKRTEALAKR
jgi:hypothetical protein